MAWFRRKRRIADEELLAQQNPLLTPGEWEQLLGERRTLHRQRSASTTREYRKDWKYILFGAFLGAVVVGGIAFVAQFIWVWRIEGYGTQGWFSMIEGPNQPLMPILSRTAWAATAGAFVMFFLRRVWRRRR